MGLASASATAPDCAQPHTHQAAERDIRFAYGVGGRLHRDGNPYATDDIADGYSSNPLGFDDLGRATANRAPLGHALARCDAWTFRYGYANPGHFQHADRHAADVVRWPNSYCSSHL